MCFNIGSGDTDLNTNPGGIYINIYIYILPYELSTKPNFWTILAMSCCQSTVVRRISKYKLTKISKHIYIYKWIQKYLCYAPLHINSCAISGLRSCSARQCHICSAKNSNSYWDRFIHRLYISLCWHLPLVQTYLKLTDIVRNVL